MTEEKKDTSSSGATRNTVDTYRHDLLVWEFIDEMARVMQQGVKSHGANNWKKGFDDNGKDIWNHIYNHQRRWREGDISEPHLAKMAVGLMFQWYFDNCVQKDSEPIMWKFKSKDKFYIQGRVDVFCIDKDGMPENFLVKDRNKLWEEREIVLIDGKKYQVRGIDRPERPEYPLAPELGPIGILVKDV